MGGGITYEWDNSKRDNNIAKHGVDFTAMQRFDWDAAMTVTDTRTDYGERRFVSIAPVGQRLHVCAWCWRGDNIRIISLRKANKREVARYAKET